MMKTACLLLLLLSPFLLPAQDSIVPRETSYENYDLLAIALAGFAVLIAIYFLWRRRKKRQAS